MHPTMFSLPFVWQLFLGAWLLRSCGARRLAEFRRDSGPGGSENFVSEDGVAARVLTQTERIPAFHLAVQAIATERNILCPADKPFEIDDIDAECCAMAIVMEHDDHFRFRLKFTTDDGTLYDVRMRVHQESTGERPVVESIKPPPCGKYERQKQDAFENVDLGSHVIQTGRSAIDKRIQDECGGARVNGTFLGVHGVHVAQTMVVEGLQLRMVVSLAEQGESLHHIEMHYNFDGKLESIVWPTLVNDVGVCGLLLQSSMDPAQMDEINSLETDPDIQSHEAAASHYFRRVGGHMQELDGAVELAPPEELVSLLERAETHAALSSAYDPRKNYPECFTGDEVRSQGSCGSCWVFAASGAMADRHCMARPELMRHEGKRADLSVQQVLSCHHRDGCDGGHAVRLFKILQNDKVHLSYEHEYPYEVRCFIGVEGVTQDFGEVLGCMSWKRVADSDPSKPCACVDGARRPREQPHCLKDVSGQFGLETYHRLPSVGERKSMWTITTYTLAEVNNAIKQVLVDEGPVYASFHVMEDWSSFVRMHRGRAVYKWDGTSNSSGHHAVVMLGWGSKNDDQPYWVLRNSWGRGWGDGGYYLHHRGTNDCEIEDGIVAPKVGSALRLDGTAKNTKKALVIFGETTFVDLRLRDGVRGALGHEKTFWGMRVNCSSPCRPTLAVLPDVSQGEVAQRGAAACCCDAEHFDPPKCMWVPNQRLAKNWTLTRASCSTYNFGRGTVRTVSLNRTGGECGSDIYGGSKVSNQLALDIERLTSSSFQIVMRLKGNIVPLGKHELRLRVEQSTRSSEAASMYRDPSEEVEHTYEVHVSKARGGPIKRLFQLRDVHYFFFRREEPVQERTFFGYQWTTATHYELRVAAKCTGACDGVARFVGLDSSKHPKGETALFLKKVQTDSSQSLLFVVAVESLPPGMYDIEVKAIPPGRDHYAEPKSDRNTETLHFAIPKISDEQGLEWEDLKVIEHGTVLNAGGWGYRCPRHWKSCAAMRYRCSKECNLISISYVSVAGLNRIDNTILEKTEHRDAWYYSTVLFEWPVQMADFMRGFSVQVADKRDHIKNLVVAMPQQPQPSGNIRHGLQQFFSGFSTATDPAQA